MSFCRKVGVLTVLGSVFCVSSAYTQDRLAAIKRLNCIFTVVASGTWNEGTPHADTHMASLSVSFNSINFDEGTARTASDQGPNYDIVVRQFLGVLHFVQSFREGSLYVTTVFDKETRPGKLIAVHTRHEYSEIVLPGFTSRPEQYYGECEPEH